jgi:hypothetical protein
MPTMPNPWTESAVAHPATVDAAADHFDGPDIPLAELVKRGFDEAGFLNDLEPLPAFLIAPSQRYLSATDLMPVLQTLAGH